MWLRFERRPRADVKSLDIYKGTQNAIDSVSLSFDGHKLWGKRDTSIAEAVFDHLHLMHVLDLFDIIRDTTPKYAVFSTNCWFFAATVIGTLAMFGSWKIHPKPDWIKSTIKILGRSTEGLTRLIISRFTYKWSVEWDQEAAQLSLTQKEAWTNSHSLHQFREVERTVSNMMLIESTS